MGTLARAADPMRGRVRVDGLAPGRHRLAFDAAGRHVFAEFDMGDEDTEREFTFRCR